MKQLSLKDLIPVDYTDGSWPEDVDGYIAYEYYKRVTENNKISSDDLYSYLELIEERIAGLRCIPSLVDSSSVHNMVQLKDAVCKSIMEFEVLDSASIQPLDEALTMVQRMKRRAIMRRNKSKIALGRRRAQRRRATPDMIKKRAMRSARNALAKKFLKKDKSDASPAERSRVEKILKTKSGAITKMARKLIPIMRKKEMAKFATQSPAAK